MANQLKSLDDLLKYEVCKLYDAESQLSNTLSKFGDKVSDQNLKGMVNDYQQHANQQMQRLESIAQNGNFDITGQKCSAMEGIIRETEELMNSSADTEVKDAGLIASLQSAKHYEMACCGSARAYAEETGNKQAADVLQQTLDEEKRTDARLNEVAINRVNKKAER
jgi:ferritin-like metal-binding protein YciE